MPVETAPTIAASVKVHIKEASSLQEEWLFVRQLHGIPRLYGAMLVGTLFTIYYSRTKNNIP